MRRGARAAEEVTKSMVDEESPEKARRSVRGERKRGGVGVNKSGNGIFDAVIPVSGYNKVGAGVGVGFDGKGVSNAACAAFPSVCASDEEAAVGDGGLSKTASRCGLT